MSELQSNFTEHTSKRIARHLLKLASEQSVTDMTVLKLMKLTYIAHGWMLGLHNRRLFKEDVVAWRYGPVIPELYDEIKGYRGIPVASIAVEETLLDDEQSNILNHVFSAYKKFNGVQLSAMTHQKDTPWHHTWHKSGSAVIPYNVLRDYYVEQASIR